MKEKLPETYTSLFNLKKYDKFEVKYHLGYNEAFNHEGIILANPYKNIELFVFFPNTENRPLVCAYSMN